MNCRDNAGNQRRMLTYEKIGVLMWRDRGDLREVGQVKCIRSNGTPERKTRKFH